MNENNSNIINFLNNILNKRVKALKKNDSIKNVRVENNCVFFDSNYATDISDCGFKINGSNIIFEVVGNEGVDKVFFDISDSENDILKKIKKAARGSDSKGLK